MSFFWHHLGYMGWMKKSPVTSADEVPSTPPAETADNMRITIAAPTAYMAGAIAGKMSASGKLGVVGLVPIPEVVATSTATLGAQS
jgi:simple sugar transport system substrate-binding protein